MADIFISYAREDRSRIEPLAKSLENLGWSVFWDRTIPAGKTWRQVIGDALKHARSVIVAWSKDSIESDWVQEEADRGRRRNILIPVLIDNVDPPLGFGAIQAADLTNWNPARSSSEFEKLISDISMILGPSPKQIKEAEKAEEQKRKRKEAEEEARVQKVEADRKAEEERKRKEVDEKRKAEEERKRKEEEQESTARAERQVQEERKRKEAEAESERAKKVLNQREVAAEKQFKQPMSPEAEPHRVNNILRFRVVLVVILLLVGGIWWFFSESEQKQKMEVAEKMVEARSPTIETKTGKLFVVAVPENASIRILNIDKRFQQGIELEPGKYQLQVSLQDYEIENRWIELNANEEKRIKFDLKKIEPKAGRLYVEAIPENAQVRILNIKPKFSPGMELESGSYQVEVSAEGYETQIRWIELTPGNEKPFRFELKKKPQELTKSRTEVPAPVIKPEPAVSTKLSGVLPQKVLIGLNVEITGSYPNVGKNSKYAAQMWAEDINKAGGLEVGGKKYTVELIFEDNEGTETSSAKAATKLITVDGVIAIVGPHGSGIAGAASDVCTNYKTLMVGGLSIYPYTNKDRPYVFSTCFRDAFQGTALSIFATEEYKFNKAAVLYDMDKYYFKEQAESFKKDWEQKHGAGSVVAYDSFTTKDMDFNSQLTKVLNSGAEFLLALMNYKEVPLIVQKAKKLGWKKPVLGTDYWEFEELVQLCGKDCFGYYFVSHFAALGAKGSSKEFVDRYKAKHGIAPSVYAALTWDAMGLIGQGIENAGKLTDDIIKNREALRNAIANTKNFPAITGTMSFLPGSGDPIKCANIVKINNNGEFEFYRFVCPQ